MFPIMEEAGVCETSEQPEPAGLILMGSPAAIVLLLALLTVPALMWTKLSPPVFARLRAFFCSLISSCKGVSRICGLLVG